MTDYRDAKAEAKATKARAKAMRPWFKKKRIMIPLGFVVLAAIGAAAGGGSDDTTNVNASDNSVDTTAAAPAPTSAGIRQGLGSKNASDDVEIINCERDAYSRKANLKVTNHSSKASNYVIEVVFETADGKEQFGTGATFISGLEPGQSKQDEAVSFDSTDTTTPGKCRVSSVQRNSAV
jgi:hypothetical protein